MSAYPTIGQHVSSKQTRRTDMALFKSLGNVASVRSFMAGATPRTFNVVHVVNATDRDTLLAFYDANRFATFSFVWDEDASTNTCIFQMPPQVEDLGNVWRVTMIMAEQEAIDLLLTSSGVQLQTSGGVDLRL